MKNAEGFKFMSHGKERSNNFSGGYSVPAIGAHSGRAQQQRPLQPWSNLGAGDNATEKDRTKSNQAMGGKPPIKYQPKQQPFQKIAAESGDDSRQVRDKAKSQV